MISLLRAALGLALGLAAATAGLTGWSGFILYAAAAMGVVAVYLRSYLDVDVESFTDTSLMTEGLQPGLAMFLLAWCIGTTLLGKAAAAVGVAGVTPVA